MKSDRLFSDRGLISLVTDRRRLSIAPEHTERSVDALVELVATAAYAGVDLIQIRERDLDAGVLCDLTRRCVHAASGTRARVLVNDRVDVALAAGAAGVHLRADSVAASDVRRIVPEGFLLGRSVHSVGEGTRAAAGGGLDYLVFGTVFSSASKPAGEAVGPAELARLTALVRLPVLAIGGITLENLQPLVRAGAAGVAAIGLFLPAVGGPGLRQQLEICVTRVRRAFDTSGAVP